MILSFLPHLFNLLSKVMCLVWVVLSTKTYWNHREGKYISYFNGQFYSDYSKTAYDEVVQNGYKPEMVVMGMLSGTDFEEELQKTYDEYGNKLGGVFVWEYFNSNPLQWLEIIKKVFNKSNTLDYCNIS